LTLNGLGGDDGIAYNSGAALHVQDGVFKNFFSAGIETSTSANARLFIEDSLFTGSANGVFMSSSATIEGTIEHSRFEKDIVGVDASSNANAVVRDSVVSGDSSSFGEGFIVNSSGAQLDIENSVTTHNHIGIYAGI